MPEFPKPDPDLTQEQALAMILSSIAMEEAALSRIICVESEKIAYVLNKLECMDHPDGIKDLLAVNKSVTELLEIVLQNQMILKNKMTNVLEYLPRPPVPPIPPTPPIPPKPPCPPPEPCRIEPPLCFDLIPGVYCCKEPLRWQNKGLLDYPAHDDPTKIRLPQGGCFIADICLELACPQSPSHELKLISCCQDQAPSITKALISARQPSPSQQRGILHLPRTCNACIAAIVVCAPHDMDIRAGRVAFIGA